MTQFRGKTKICYGRYALDTLEELPCTRAFVVTDPFMVKSGFADQITSHLERRNIPHCLFSHVEPDPSLETVKRGTVEFVSARADLIVALGGGSAIDTAKAIAFFAGRAAPQLPRPLLAAIPTTSGTGSEVTAISVVTDKTHGVKIPLNDELLIPDVAILDARFTRTVPPSVTAATGMDVLTHAVEAYTSRENNAFTDMLAVQAIRYVFSFLFKAYQQMEDMQAREMMLLGSCMAGMAFNNSGLGITHSMAHALGGQFHIPHGLANAVLLPHTIRFNSFDAGVRYRELARIIGLPHANVEEGTSALVEAVLRLNENMGIPTRIRDLKVEETAFRAALDTMASHALDDMCTKSNPRRPSLADLRLLLEQAW
ncbi:1-propanol dehydrogenase PduQ [uncultured Mailhella sp.]|uniref:1-propanol dehydrogenase PduQ n=1 Tax=uncultured Mailhella sp. TaxID=1981031 RepID=UPI00261D5933|nr:1-propanol dehydrogenase PduQ [uncultured Mailhella sp.]